MPRIAWFSPMPPVPSGIAVDSAAMVAALRRVFDIDVFTDERTARAAKGTARGLHSAHDFLWRHHREPYDLTVYQLGNSSAHDFLWPYLFRFPGLAVLHDAHLHHARAAALLRQGRTDDYRAEFAANHPDTSADLAELGIAGFDTQLYYLWPMTRLVALTSRVTAVHAPLMKAAIERSAPGAVVETIRLGHGEAVSEDEVRRARAAVRARHGIADSTVVFGVFGALTPDKRVPQSLRALHAVLPYAPGATLLLVGAPAGHYDLDADARDPNVSDRVITTGRVDDSAFTEYIAACDVSVNLRWPTAREISGPWLRALGAGRPTITIDLEHMADVPSLDGRTWTVKDAPASLNPREPVTVTVDLLHEDRVLPLVFRRLAVDHELRARLGRAARAYWESRHAPDRMAEDYVRVIGRALQTPARRAELPAHLRSKGDEHLDRVLAPFDFDANLWSTI